MEFSEAVFTDRADRAGVSASLFSPQYFSVFLSFSLFIFFSFSSGKDQIKTTKPNCFKPYPGQVKISIKIQLQIFEA